MARYRIGADAKELEDAKCSNRDGAERRLRDIGLPQRRFVSGLFRLDEGRDRKNAIAKSLAARIDLEQGVGLRQCLLHLRKAARQIAKHAGVLRALSREDHGQHTGGGALAEINAVRGTPFVFAGERFQQSANASQDLRRVASALLKHNQQPEHITGTKRCPTMRGFRGNNVPGRGRRKCFDGRMEIALRIRRKGQQLHAFIPVDRHFPGPIFFEDAVKIASAETEGADRGTTRILGIRQPRPSLGIDVEGALF